MTDTPQRPTEFYHGSKTEIRSDYLQPQRAFNSVQDKLCFGAFVTSDLDQAKFFAINSCISGNGHSLQKDNRIYLERLSPHIQTHFHVYTVHETKENPFIHDRGSEYYSTKPIRITSARNFDTAKEIQQLGYEICVLDVPLKSKANLRSGNNFDVQAEMAKAVKEGKYHLVNIDEIIEKQSKNVFYRIFRNFLQND